MMNIFRLIQEIRDELRLIRNFLAKIANVSAEELQSLAPNYKQDYSKAEYIPPKSDEEIFEEEDNELTSLIESRVTTAKNENRESFYTEDNISDLVENVNEG